MTRRPFTLRRSLRADSSGAALVEFGLVAPLFVLLLIGMFEFGMQVYARSLLHGAMQEASRTATLEGSDLNLEELDNSVTWQFRNVIPRAEIEYTRTNYLNFSDVQQPEDYTDTNGDGACNNNEPFEDVNGNGTWDADRGQAGQGSARDAVLYVATARYQRMFPLHGLMGWEPDVTVEASTVLRNQPFDTQAQREPVVENCS